MLKLKNVTLRKYYQGNLKEFIINLYLLLFIITIIKFILNELSMLLLIDAFITPL